MILVDLTPEALRERLRAGKVYAPERAKVALDNFFRGDKLSALRELALREVAEDVEQRRDGAHARAAQPAGGRRTSARARRAAAEVAADHAARLAFGAATRWRDGRALGAAPGASRRPRRKRPSSQPSGVSPCILGVHFLEEEGDDLVATVRRVAVERGSTYVFVGTPDESRRREIFGGSLLSRMVRELPGVDIRVVASRGERSKLEAEP